MTFWQHHGALFLICAVLFPRLTILFATGLSGILGVLGWFGWLVLPRFVIAYYATAIYSATNPFLVACAWLSAVLCLCGGGSGSAGVSVRRAA